MFLLLVMHDEDSFRPKHVVCLTIYVTPLLNHTRISNEVNGIVIILVRAK